MRELSLRGGRMTRGVRSEESAAGATAVSERKAEAYDVFPGADRDRPWDDGDLLRRLYIDDSLSMSQIAKGWSCSPSTVRKYLNEHGIPKRSRAEAAQAWRGTRNKIPLSVHTQGTMCWQTGDGEDRYTVYVHRLLAVAEWGFDAVCEMDVHHKNEIRWDNRPDNLELLSHSDHTIHHGTKIDGLDRVRIAELYENGNVGFRRLHDLLEYDDVHWTTLMNIHHEFYGDGAA